MMFGRYEWCCPRCGNTHVNVVISESLPVTATGFHCECGWEGDIGSLRACAYNASPARRDVDRGPESKVTAEARIRAAIKLLNFED